MAVVNHEARFVAQSGGVIVDRMSTLVPVDSVDIRILVDNVTDIQTVALCLVKGVLPFVRREIECEEKGEYS